MLGPKLRTITAGFLLLATVGSSTFAMLQPEAYNRSFTPSGSSSSGEDKSQVSFSGNGDKVQGDGNAGALASEEGSLVDIILGSGGSRDHGVIDRGDATTGPTVADLLTTERTASLWWSYARDSVEIVCYLLCCFRPTHHFASSLRVILEACFSPLLTCDQGQETGIKVEELDGIGPCR